MKYLVTLKRRETMNPVQNARRMRVEVDANSERDAIAIALFKNNNGKYFVFESARRA